MKKLTLAILVVALGAVVSYFSVQHYSKYQKQQTDAQQVQVDKESKLSQDLAAEKAKSARLSTQYTATRLECEKGIAAYGQLTVTQKKALPAPTTCGPAEVQ